MARNSIKYELKNALREKESYGRSKHNDKLATYEKRAEMKKQGCSYEERLEVNELKDHIYSYSTMKTYQQQVGYFGDWLIAEGHKKINLEDSKDYIQDYIHYLEEDGKSPYSINTALAAICKATGACQHDYTHPPRTIANIERGSGERRNDKYNEKNHADILDANRLLGLRRNELRRLRAKDIVEKDGVVIVQTKGKGGRHNEQIYIFEDEKEMILALKAGKEPEDKLFSRDRFDNDADLHNQRALRAQDVYNRVLEDMRLHPERREYYKQQIQSYYETRGRICKENLDNPYCIRGALRQKMTVQNRDCTFDRVAVLFVSISVLSHTRSDTTVEHYLCK